MALAPMKAKVKRSENAFKLWILAYVTILIVSALLMGSSRFNTFFLMAILALLIVLLYVMARVIMSFVRNVLQH